MFSLFLGFSGFLLLVILLSIVFVGQSDEEMILVNATDEENKDNDATDTFGENEHLNGIVSRARYLVNIFSQFICRMMKIPVVLYSNLLNFYLEVNRNGDLISIQ